MFRPQFWSSSGFKWTLSSNQKLDKIWIRICQRISEQRICQGNILQNYKYDKKNQSYKCDEKVKNGYSIKIGIRTETCQKSINDIQFHFESSSRSRANSCELIQVCWRGIALYATMLLCSLYKFVRCGLLVIAACCLVIQCVCFKEADLSIAPTKFMQLHRLIQTVCEYSFCLFIMFVIL
jgi:hypothetical protein